MQAIDEDEGGLLFRIIQLRAYARAKENYDNTPMEKRSSPKGMMRLVSEITMDLAAVKIEAQLKKQNG
jgi:hypothetical protein